MPVAYHSRASSIVPSGTAVRRPNGQYLSEPAEDNHPGDRQCRQPRFGPSEKLDFEMELAALIGVGNGLSQPILVDSGGEHVFGFLLLNDWSGEYIFMPGKLNLRAP